MCMQTAVVYILLQHTKGLREYFRLGVAIFQSTAIKHLNTIARFLIDLSDNPLVGRFVLFYMTSGIYPRAQLLML